MSPTLLARSRLSVIARPRERRPIIFDSFTQGATEIDLENHDADVDLIDAGPSWERHPSSVGQLAIGGATAAMQNKAWNGSGSGKTLYRHLTPPGSCDYRVTCPVETISTVSGHFFAAAARMSATLDTCYLAYVFVADPGNHAVRLQKSVGGIQTVLQETIIASGLPAIGSKWKTVLDCSNDEKVVYVAELLSAGPPEVWGPLRRLCSSGDNTIPEAGSAGIVALRCNATDGFHMDSFTMEVNGPQPQSGQSVAPTPDPTQSPAVLWTPDYTGGASDTLALPGTKWRVETEPYVRGVLQTTRMSIVAGGSVPGSGPYKPAQAMRVELRSFHAGNFTVTLTADAADTASDLTMSPSDIAQLVNFDMCQVVRTGEVIRVVGTPSGSTATVLRHQRSTAFPLLAGDTITVFGGDVSDSGNESDAYASNRAEVYDRWGPTGSSPPTSWPDPLGSVRWYRVRIFIPLDFPTAYSTANWTTLDQWKGNFGGSPPRAFEVAAGGTFELGGTRTRIGLGSINAGNWSEFIFGFRWETSGIDGWVQVYRDGALIVPKRYEATMDFKFNRPTNGADPVYYKQGIYRSAAHANTMVIYYSAPVVATTYESARDAA